MRQAMTETYNIGQIVYLIPEGTSSIVAGRVLEERIKRTKDGDSSSWIIEHFVNGELQQLDLTNVKCETFSDDKKLRKTLIKRATDSLNSMIDGVVERMTKEFNQDSTMIEQAHVRETDPWTTSEEGVRYARVQLSDGTTARAILNEQ